MFWIMEPCIPRPIISGGECFSVELDDSAYTRCMATVYAASSIPDSITTFKKSEGVTYGFVMNQLYQAMLISKNKPVIIDNQGQLFDLFMRLSKSPEDLKLFKQLKDFVGSLEHT